jgi:hypothetical protein
MSTGLRERLRSLPLASADEDDPLRPMLLMQGECVPVIRRLRRKSNGWAERGAEILRKSGDYAPRHVKPKCDCDCHNYCSLCGRPFIEGQWHINCADTADGMTTSTNWNYFGPGGFGSALTD